MEQLPKVGLLQYEKPARLTIKHGDYTSDDDGHIRRLDIGRGEVEIFSSTESPGDYRVMLYSAFIQNLTDSEIVELVRGGIAVGEIYSYINSLRWIIESQDKVLNLYTIDQLKKEHSDSFSRLKNLNNSLIQSGDDSHTHITALLTDIESVFTGNYRLSGYVYCLTDQLGHYKIGMSRQVDTRIKQLATQPPFEIQLIASHLVYDMRQYESCLHWLFREKRLRGEWFTLSEADVESFVNATWPSQYMRQRHLIYGGL